MTTIRATVPLYHTDQTRASAEVSVTSCMLLSDSLDSIKPLFTSPAAGDYSGVFLSCTDKTIFHPQGGGQPSDTGIFTDGTRTFRVSRVRQQGIEVLHCGSMDPSSADTWLSGEHITQRIAVRRRTLYSRLHTAGHIIGLSVRALGAKGEIPQVSELKASHFPDASSVEFRGRIEGSAKEAIQKEVDSLLWKDRTVLLHQWSPAETNERCTGVPEGGLKSSGAGEKGDEPKVRVVEIEGAGSYPCGGTHLPRTSDVGRIVVRTIKRSKDVTKISYRVGNTEKTETRDKEAIEEDRAWMTEDDLKETGAFFEAYFKDEGR